jgi:NAD+ synthase (glutamine-hydrolysing)
LEQREKGERVEARNPKPLKVVRVGAATLNQTPLDLEGNADRIVAMMEKARAARVEILVLPELCLTGYGCEDAFFRPGLSAGAIDILAGRLAKASKGLVCAVGLPVFIEGNLYNAVAVLVDGKVAGINAKRRLPRDGVHYEPRWFRPWVDATSVEIDCGGAKVPFGDLVYEINGARVALEICEEAWGAVPAAAASAGFADIVLNPSASHFALGKFETREHLVANSSRSFGVCYVYSNLVGLEAGRIIYDGGAMIACDGKLIARGRRFSFDDGDLVAAEAQLDSIRSSKMRKRSFSEGLDSKAGPGQLRIIQASAEFPEPAAGAKIPFSSSSASVAGRGMSAASGQMPAEEEFLRACALGLFDYLRKSGSKGFALSLSGGCDSSVCAVLVAQMRHLAIAELGESGFLRRSGLSGASMESLLLCAWQSTRQSSGATHEAARAVAAAIGARFVEINVDPAVDFYVSEASRVLGRKLDWQHDDLTLQNIQARARAPMIWLLANAGNRLLLTTANRSEAAVGYTTMDGDSAGGLAPLAGIDKAFLLDWVRWAARDCQIGTGAVTALEKVFAQPPTAELRPASAHQTDESDLMPYVVLKKIEACRVRDKLDLPETYAAVGDSFPEVPVPQVKAWVDRFEQLWRTSQWKRERFAPSFHLDDFSVDPKTFCRFPIFSGNS